jgi:hypothetical protein
VALPRSRAAQCLGVLLGHRVSGDHKYGESVPQFGGWVRGWQPLPRKISHVSQSEKQDATAQFWAVAPFTKHTHTHTNALARGRHNIKFNITLPRASVTIKCYLLPSVLRTTILHGFLPPPYVLLPLDIIILTGSCEVYKFVILILYTLPLIFSPRSKHSPILNILKHLRTVFIPKKEVPSFLPALRKKLPFF